MTGISVFSPVPQGVEYGGPCRRRHNALAECRAAPALLTAYAVRLAVGNRFYAPRCSASSHVLAGGAELRSWLCTRAVVCFENMRRALRPLYAAQKTERFLVCLRVGRMCADIWSGFAFPVPPLSSKKMRIGRRNHSAMPYIARRDGAFASHCRADAFAARKLRL